MNMKAENPRAIVGSNTDIDYGARVTSEMESAYAELVAMIDKLLAEARDQPKEIDDDATATAVGRVVKELRDTFARADAYREAEKAPYLRSEQAVDAFFFALMEKLRRRNPRDRNQKPGAADILQARLDDFLERKRIEEENRRRAEAAKAAEELRRANEEAARKVREAEEARLAAERARKPETVESKTAVAEAKVEEANTAIIDAALAQAQAEEARIATLAKPADMSRTRGDGVLLTQAKENYALVLDRDKLDKAALWPFFTDAEIEKALRGWARTTNFAKQMDGAEVGSKRKGVTR